MGINVLRLRKVDRFRDKRIHCTSSKSNVNMLLNELQISLFIISKVCKRNWAHSQLYLDLVIFPRVKTIEIRGGGGTVESIASRYPRQALSVYPLYQYITGPIFYTPRPPMIPLL